MEQLKIGHVCSPVRSLRSMVVRLNCITYFTSLAMCEKIIEYKPEGVLDVMYVVNTQRFENVIVETGRLLHGTMVVLLFSVKKKTVKYVNGPSGFFRIKGNTFEVRHGT